MGEMRGSVESYSEMTLRELFKVIQTHRKYEENKYKDRWIQTQMVCYVSVLPHAKKGARIKPDDVLRLPWSSTQESKEKTKEEIKAMLESVANRYKTGPLSVKYGDEDISSS